MRSLRAIWTFLFFIGLLAPGYLYCQNDEIHMQTATLQHTLGISAGINDLHFKDEYLSPIIFRGIMFSSGIFYNLRAGDIRHAVNINYAAGNPNSGIQARDISQKVFSLSYSFIFGVDSWKFAGGRFDLSTGAGLSSFVMNTDFLTQGSSPEDNFIDQSWYWSHSFDLHLLGEYKLSERSQFSFMFTMPAVRVVSRPGNGHFYNSRNSDIMYNHYCPVVKF